MGKKEKQGEMRHPKNPGSLGGEMRLRVKEWTADKSNHTRAHLKTNSL